MTAHSNLSVWNKVSQAPSHFLKEIEFGYLKGKSDISPQWRLMAMTQAYGQVGHGWTYRIVRLWSEAAADGNVMAFAEVAVKTKVDGEWGEEFWGIGGSTIVDKNKNGIQANDEGYKKATTDALGVAFKAVGVAADVYLGNFDGSKYLYDYSAAYFEPEPPKRNPNHTYNANGVRTLNQSEFDAAIGAVKSGKVTIETMLDESKFALDGEQHAFVVNLSDEMTDDLHDLEHSQLPSEA